jgi:hypothetical protein
MIILNDLRHGEDSVENSVFPSMREWLQFELPYSRSQGGFFSAENKEYYENTKQRALNLFKLGARLDDEIVCVNDEGIHSPCSEDNDSNCSKEDKEFIASLER